MARPFRRGHPDLELEDTACPQILTQRAPSQPDRQHNPYPSQSKLIHARITRLRYAHGLRSAGYSEAVRHVMNCKTRFDRRVLDSREGEVIFEVGQLIQIYRNDIAKSIGSERKLLPVWSEPHRIRERLLNSYKVETLEGHLLEGEYHARRLREFIPREGTELANRQKEIGANQMEEIDNDIEEHLVNIPNEGETPENINEDNEIESDSGV